MNKLLGPTEVRSLSSDNAYPWQLGPRASHPQRLVPAAPSIHLQRPLVGLFFFLVVLWIAASSGAQGASLGEADEVGDSYTIRIKTGYNLIANQLDQRDNTLAALLPVVPEGSQLFKWDVVSGTFRADTYDSLIGGWTGSDGVPSVTSLGAYEAAQLFNPGAEYDLVFSGQPSRDVLPPPALEQERLYYLSGPIKASASYVDVTGLAPEEGSRLIRFVAATQVFETNVYRGGAWVLGEPLLAVGEGVAIWIPKSVACGNQQTFLRLFSGEFLAPPNSVLMSAGSLDPRFKTAMPPFPAASPAVPGSLPPFWIPNSPVSLPGSEWLGVGTGAGASSGPIGVYAYTNEFYLPCINGAKIVGRYAADDTASIWINGGHTPNDTTLVCCSVNWKSVSITSGFQVGLNTMVFYVTNLAAGPTGLRTELTGTYCPAGNNGSCPPCLQFACPPNVVVEECAPGQGVVVNYPPPTLTNGCNGTAKVLCFPYSGQTFYPGTHTVTCYAVDTLGHEQSCNFTITVNPAPNPIPTHTRVWNTGAPAGQAANFSVIKLPSGPANLPVVLTAQAIGAWLPNTAVSSWVSYTADSSAAPAGLYRYRLAFNLPCTAGASIVGRIATDDWAAVHLNGVPTGIMSPSFGSWTAVNLTSGFVVGANTLDLWVTNDITYTGVRAELTNHFSECCGCVPPPAGMVLWLPLDETSAGTALNAVAPFPGTHVGNLSVGTAGYVGKSVTFPGINSNPNDLDHIEVPNYPAINFSNSDFTFDAWIKPNNAQRTQVILGKFDKVTEQGYSFFIKPSFDPNTSTFIYVLGARLGGGGGPAYLFDDLGCAVRLGVWSHVTVTVRPGVVNGVVGYVNGQAGTTPGTVTVGNFGNASPLWVGEDQAAVNPHHSIPVLGDLRGEVDEVELFNRALAPAEIESLFLAGQQGKCKHSGRLPSEIPFCLNDSSVAITAWICNATTQPQSYTYWFQGYPPHVRPGLAIWGPTTFTPASGTTLFVAPGACVPISVNVDRSLGMTHQDGDLGLYRMFFHPVGSPGAVFSTDGLVRDARDTCPTLLKLDVRISGPNLELSWLTGTTNLEPEATDNLGAPRWILVDAPVEEVNGRSVVKLPIKDSKRFFRLRRSDLR